MFCASRHSFQKVRTNLVSVFAGFVLKHVRSTCRHDKQHQHADIHRMRALATYAGIFHPEKNGNRCRKKHFPRSGRESGPVRSGTTNVSHVLKAQGNTNTNGLVQGSERRHVCQSLFSVQSISTAAMLVVVFHLIEKEMGMGLNHDHVCFFLRCKVSNMFPQSKGRERFAKDSFSGLWPVKRHWISLDHYSTSTFPTLKG